MDKSPLPTSNEGNWTNTSGAGYPIMLRLSEVCIPFGADKEGPSLYATWDVSHLRKYILQDLQTDLIDETRSHYDKLQDHQPMPSPSLVDEKTQQHCYLPCVQIVSVIREPRYLRTSNNPHIGSTVSENVAIGLQISHISRRSILLLVTRYGGCTFIHLAS